MSVTSFTSRWYGLPHNNLSGDPMFMHLSALASAALTTAIVASSSAGAATDAKPAQQRADLTIYHIEGRRSERIVWLCEELGRPYKLEYKRGNIAASMATHS